MAKRKRARSTRAPAGETAVDVDVDDFDADEEEPEHKGVKVSYFVGGGSFPHNGDVIKIPGGRVATDEVLGRFAPEDRTNIILHALRHGCKVEFEYADPPTADEAKAELEEIDAELAKLQARKATAQAVAQRAGIDTKA